MMGSGLKIKKGTLKLLWAGALVTSFLYLFNQFVNVSHYISSISGLVMGGFLISESSTGNLFDLKKGGASVWVHRLGMILGVLVLGHAVVNSALFFNNYPPELVNFFETTKFITAIAGLIVGAVLAFIE